MRVMNVNNMRGRYKGLGNTDSAGNFIAAFPDYVTLSPSISNMFDTLATNADVLDNQFQSYITKYPNLAPGAGNILASISPWIWVALGGIVIFATVGSSRKY